MLISFGCGFAAGLSTGFLIVLLVHGWFGYDTVL